MTPSRAPSLEVRIGSLTLRNPVLIASGIIGYGTEYEGLVDLDAIGGIVTKTVTRHARAGNPPPRVVEVAAGMLNSIGIENPGLEGFLETSPILGGCPCAVIVRSGGGHTRVLRVVEGEPERAGARDRRNISAQKSGPPGSELDRAGLERRS